MPKQQVVSGPKGRVLKFIRASGRCPADDFCNGCVHKMWKRFAGSFQALAEQGERYYNAQRFKPLIGDGKPLWEFKEHDHRLYCHRRVIDGRVEAVLLNGWVKDKRGKTKEEIREIGRARGYMDEFLAEPGGLRK